MKTNFRGNISLASLINLFSLTTTNTTALKKETETVLSNFIWKSS